MGRVYDVNAEAPGVDPAVGLRLIVKAAGGDFVRLCGVKRVEFESDADEGWALVTYLVRSPASGRFVMNGGRAAVLTERLECRVLRRRGDPEWDAFPRVNHGRNSVAVVPGAEPAAIVG